MPMTTGNDPMSPAVGDEPNVDLDKLVDEKIKERTTVPIVGDAAAAQKPEGMLLPGEPGAPPIGEWHNPESDKPAEVPFASPPPPQPGVPAGMSVLPGSNDTLPVAPGTIIPDDQPGGPGPVGNEPEPAKPAARTRK